MRFAHHLSSHLTPEWRKHYIDYDDLKRRVYEMIGKKPQTTAEDDEELLEDENVRKGPDVDKNLQAEFFSKIEEQLDDINSFFRAREAQAAHKLHEYTEEVELLTAMRANRRTQKLRSTRNKHRSLKAALSEFYLNLSLLQNFQQLNHTGFRKVLKKHDKLARSKTGKEVFKNKVCQAYFWTSPELAGMIERTETLMIERLEDGNRSKAMNRLRVPPLETRDVRSHWATLAAGFLMGFVFVSIIVNVIAIALLPEGSWQHLTPVLRGLRVGFILSVWFYFFAIDTYIWRRNGINNVLIFEFDPRNYLNFVELFGVASLTAALFMVGVYLTVFSHYLHYPEWVGPLVMLGLMAILFAAPVPFYHKTRIWLAKLCSRIFLAPFFHVNFADFWIADQMNSLAVVFLDLEFFFCFLFYGLHFPDNSIQCGSVKYGFRSLVAVLPAWYRFAQCLRRYYDTRHAFPHLVNAGKYSTSFFVVFFSGMATGFRDQSKGLDDQSGAYYSLFLMWVLSAIISTCYTFTWDIKMDWGLFSGKYKLRAELLYSKKVYYMLAIVEDLVFRSLWTLNISVGEGGAGILEGNILGSILAVLEVFRRFVWNLFRLENEQLTNVGEFRVVRDISIHPLNPSEVPVDDEEEGQELAMRKHIVSQQRKLSRNLIELRGASVSVSGSSSAGSSDEGSVLRSRRRKGLVSPPPPTLLEEVEWEEKLDGKEEESEGEGSEKGGVNRDTRTGQNGSQSGQNTSGESTTDVEAASKLQPQEEELD